MNAHVLHRERRRESGAALLVTVLLLVLMGLLGFAALETVATDQKVAGFQNQRTVALHAAEAGVSDALVALTTTGTPAVSTGNLADGTAYPYGQPSFGPDPNVTDPVEDMGAAPFPNMNLSLGQNGAPLFQLQMWRIHVEGSSGSSAARVQVATGALVGN